MKFMRSLISRIRLSDRLRPKSLTTPEPRAARHATWHDILANSRSQWDDALVSADGGPRVLIAMVDGQFTPGTVVHSLLGVALTLRRAKVEILLCDGVLPACLVTQMQGITDIVLALDGPSHLCQPCQLKGQAAFEPLGLPLWRFGQFLCEADYAWASELAQTTALEQIGNFTLDGVSVGEHAMAGCLRYFAVGSLDGERLAEPVLRRYFQAALLTVVVLRKLFDQNEYSAVVMSDGIYVPHGIIAEVARLRKIHVVTWHAGLRKGTIIASHNNDYHRAMLKESNSVWENMSWDTEREKSIMEYLESRALGGNSDWFSMNRSPMDDTHAIRSELGIDPSRPIVGMLTNVMWDAQVMYTGMAYATMLEWATETVRYFGNRPDLQLVIRVHPAETNGGTKSRQTFAQEIRKAFLSLPENVRLIPPTSRISTYRLATMCTSVLIFGTKAGFELAALGVPIIVAGSAQVRGKGIAWEASTPDEYIDLLDKLPMGGGMDADTVQRARKFAYYFFLQRMIAITALKPLPAWPLFELGISSHKELLPGEDQGLDVICDGILTGSEFVISRTKSK